MSNSSNKGEGKKMTVSQIISLVLKAVAVAMGIAVIVLSTIAELPVKTAVIMLAAGLICLAIDSLPKK